MCHFVSTIAFLGTISVLSACGQSGGPDVSRAVSEAAAAEAGSIRQIMLTVAEPGEAIAYFRREVTARPDDVDALRGLSRSLVRGGRSSEAVVAWRKVVSHPGGGDEDRVELADALIRTSDWTGARAALDSVPPTYETFERYRLEAMVADSGRQWGRADSFYETAIGLTTTPAGVLNNWGYSKLSRGDAAAAERLFTEAITYDPKLFTAKNNLVLARSSRRTYALPVIPMTQEERAQLLHTAGLSALKQGDRDIARTLLQDAIDTNPKYFEAAVRALQALDA